jgi:1,4-alpha-glucan branching enzyme
MIKKQFLKSKPVCKATFALPVELVPEANNVEILGEFNAWGADEKVVMKKQKNGIFKAIVELEKGKEFQFRYLVDGKSWINDDQADAYVPSEYGEENCVINTMN